MQSLLYSQIESQYCTLVCETVKSSRYLRPPTFSSPCNQACCRGKDPRWPAAGGQWRSWWSATCTGHISGASQLWMGWGTRGGRCLGGWWSTETELGNATRDSQDSKQRRRIPTKHWYDLRQYLLTSTSGKIFLLECILMIDRGTCLSHIAREMWLERWIFTGWIATHQSPCLY